KNTTIYSNGIHLNTFEKISLEKVLDSLKKIVITFDSLDENYDLRGNIQLELLELIKKIVNYSKEKLEIKIGINLYNLNNLDYTIKSLLDIGVLFFSFNLIHDIKNSEKNVKITSKEDFQKIFNILNKYKNNFEDRLVESFYSYYKGDIQNLIKGCICGDKFKFINCEGKEYPCPANLNNEKNKELCFSEECINLWEMF
ncbi:MAG: hypothetical protein ACRCZ2_12815, partial [Fusobacteriaceae bacterium]